MWWQIIAKSFWSMIDTIVSAWAIYSLVKWIISVYGEDEDDQTS